MELRGNLRDFSLPDIIQLVGFGRKTGVLRLNCTGVEAAVFFEDGNVIHADFPEAGAQGIDAVHRLFRVPEGEFYFHKEVASAERTIAMDPTNLVMEAARLADESRREECDAERAAALAEESRAEAPQDDRGDGSSSPLRVKREIKALLERRFGRNAERLTQAVDRCGDSSEELIVLSGRVEKYVHVFLDRSASQTVGQEIRGLIEGPPSSS